MRAPAFTLSIALVLSSWWGLAAAQDVSLHAPASVQAGDALAIQTGGSGKAVLYIVGPGQVIRRDVQLGETVSFEAGDMHDAGHYVLALAGSSSTQTAELVVTPATEPTKVNFLAKPSRLAVDRKNAISGVAYVFDAFGNLVLNPTKVSFDLSENGAAARSEQATSRNGVAWVRLDSAQKAGRADFQVRAGKVSVKRIVQQVPAEPCTLHMNARAVGDRVELQTDPLRDCTGNPVPDGTIVTFKEAYGGSETTVDVPLKRGIAQTSVPMRQGANISVATGVVIGNEIRWSGR